MKSVLEILEQAKKRVSKSWIQFYFAKDETGKPIMGNDPNAVSWCAVGALSQMGSLWGFSGNVEQARSFIEQQILYEDLACWNNVPGADPGGSGRPFRPGYQDVGNERSVGSMKSVLEILEQAKERVTIGWTRDHLAKDKDGNPVMGSSPKAVRWCAFGALSAPPSKSFNEAYRFITDDVLCESLAPWNNAPERTQEEVVDLFDRAIKMWKAS